LGCPAGLSPLVPPLFFYPLSWLFFAKDDVSPSPAQGYLPPQALWAALRYLHPPLGAPDRFQETPSPFWPLPERPVVPPTSRWRNGFGFRLPDPLFPLSSSFSRVFFLFFSILGPRPPCPILLGWRVPERLLFLAIGGRLERCRFFYVCAVVDG